MYQIVKAEKLAEKIFLMDVKAPRVAKACQPGEFVIVKIDEKGERIPLTICDFDRKEGTVTLYSRLWGRLPKEWQNLGQEMLFRILWDHWDSRQSL